MKAVFLDRDGVINEYPGDFQYVTGWEKFRFLPGIEKGLKRLSGSSFKIFVVSNQAGVSKGVYPQSVLDEITSKMLAGLADKGIAIDGVYYCIHRDEDNCSCRKPQAGLVHQAVSDMKRKGIAIDLEKSFFIGDTIRDVKAGKAAGLKTVLVFSGKEKAANSGQWEVKPDFVALNLSEAAEIILNAKQP